MFLPSLASIATKNVITVTTSDTIAHAVDVMNTKNIRDIIVTAGASHFILTIHDIIRFQLEGVDFDTKLSTQELQLVPEVHIRASLFEAIDSIKEGIDHLCLVDAEKNLIGIISYSDLVSSVDTEIFAEHKNLGDILGSRHFLYVSADMPTKAVFVLMQEDHHSCAVIYQGTHPQGMLTQKDIIKLVHQNADLSKSVSTYMSSPIKSVPVGMSINEALEYSRNNKIKRIVVSSDNGEVILGVISQKELFAIAYGRWSRLVKDQQKHLEEAVRIRTFELQQEIVQRKKTEQELEVYKSHLEDLVAKKTQEIEEHKERQLAQLFHQSRISAMGEMIRSVAHHWRQPLNIIAMELQDIKFAFKDGRLNAEYLDDAVAQGMITLKEMSKTIDFARGMFEESERTDCCALELVKKSFSLVSADLKHSGIEVIASCVEGEQMPLDDCLCDLFSSDTKLVSVYTGEFQQVIVALVSNAKDAILARRTSEDGQYMGKITVSFRIDGDFEVITISDNGGGIGDDALSRIFDPFFTTKDIGKGKGVITGVGLGLYFAKLVIEDKMDGRLNVANNADGASFELRMPYLK
jgi:signal transduction histidine kinase/CBS domain-containing protein